MRKDKPTGKEIAEKSKNIKLDKEKTVEKIHEGKKIKFTPAILDHISVEDLEHGQIIGILDNEIKKEGKLPPGKYNLFISKVNDEWQGFVETDNNIGLETSKVTLHRHHWGDYKLKKPTIKFKSVCVRVCLIPSLFYCQLEVEVCS